MEGKKRFSIVTPAYNASDYIGEMIESVIAQTYPFWELIIVDDGSADSTGEVVRRYAVNEPRIRYVELEENSGTCFRPRQKAMELAEGDYIVNIDADDYVSPDYLEKFAGRIKQTGADLVYADLYLSEDGRHTFCLPSNSVDRNKIFRGKDLFKASLDDWKVSGLAATSRELSLHSLQYFNRHMANEAEWSAFDNENLSRLDLYFAGKVAFSDGKYFYRQVKDSITHKISPKRFGLLKSDMVLVDFIRREFGKKSEEYVAANRQLFHHAVEGIRDLNNNRLLDSREDLNGIVREALGAVDRKAVKARVSRKYYFLTGLGYRTAKLLLKLYGRG